MYARILFVFACCCALFAAYAQPACAAPADDQYAVAAGHYSLGRWEMAIDEFERFLADYPGEPRTALVHFYMGEALLQSQAMDQAAEHFAASRQVDPNSPLAHRSLFRLGEIDYLSGADRTAIEQLEAFQAASADDPLNAYALPYLADLRLRSGDAAAAEVYYQTALQRYPAGPMATACRFGLARAAEAQNQHEIAAQRYAELSQGNELSAEALLRLGRLHYSEGDYPAAIEALARFGRDHAEHPQATDAHYWLAMAHWQQGEYDPALELFESALAAEPAHTLAPAMHFYAAEAYRVSNRQADALPHYEAILSSTPESQWAEPALLASMQIALAERDNTRVVLLAQRHAEQFPTGSLGASVTRIEATALIRQEEFTQAATKLTALLEASGETSTEWDRATTRYLLALAHLGQRQWEEVVAALDGLEPPPASEPNAHELATGILATRATALMELARYEEAIPQLEAHLALAPTAERSQAQLAVAHARLGHWPQAATALAPLTESPLYLPTVQALAQAALAAGETQRAVAWNEVLATSGDANLAAAGQRGLAWSQLADEEQGASINSFEAFLATEPAGPEAAEARLALASLYEREGEIESALETYLAILERHGDSPQLPAALLGAARLYEESERDAQAAELLEQLTANYPEFPQLDAALYRWAWALDDLEQPAAADAQFERLYQEYPESNYWADACYRLAQRAAAREDFAQAEKLTQELLARAPENALAVHALYLHGQVAAHQGDWATAATDMQQLLESHANSSLALPARYWLGEAYFHQEQFEAASAAFDEVAAATQGRNENWLAMVELRRLQLAAQAEDWPQVAVLHPALDERFPEFTQQFEADYLLGRALAAQARLNDARAIYEQVTQDEAARGSETAAMAQWMIGETYLHQRNYTEAIRAYHRVELLHDYPQWQAAALLQAGKCYEAQGRWSQALDIYERITANYEDNLYTEQAEQRLEFVRQRAAAPSP